jgi:hypothetical protein
MSSQAVSSTPVKFTPVSGAPKSQFNSFSHEYDNLLTDDYLNKIFTVKYTGKGQNFQLGAKESFNYKTVKGDGKDVKDTDITVFDKEVKIITQVEGRNIETKFGKGQIRTWADLGVYNVGKDINFTAKVKSSDKFTDFKGWVNGEYKGAHCNANVRFEMKSKDKPYLNTKVIMTEKDVRAGIVAKVGFNGFEIKRHNLFVQYSGVKDLNLWLGHYTLDGDAPKDIGTIIGAAVYKLNKHSVVFQGQWQKSTKNIGATFGVKSEIQNNTTIKAKVNQAGLFSLVAKRVHNKNLSVLVGTELNLTKPAEAYKASRAIPVPLFASLEFTYN